MCTSKVPERATISPISNAAYRERGLSEAGGILEKGAPLRTPCLAVPGGSCSERRFVMPM